MAARLQAALASDMPTARCDVVVDPGPDQKRSDGRLVHPSRRVALVQQPSGDAAAHQPLCFDRTGDCNERCQAAAAARG